MQQAINDGVIFEASADTPDFSPELAAAFGFTQAQAEAVLKPALAARDLPGFLQRFLAFLADRGISCSNPRRFTEKVTEHASHEGLHRLIAMLMSRIRDEGVCFVFHNESPDELPRLAASLPGELADTREPHAMKTTCYADGITAAPLSPQEWRALLRAKGWKQKDLARRWNVSETWISKLANNPDRGTHWNDACRGLP
ncbi:helix-turn-helix domain-containing protein, partial [Escherichia coli]|uniref:helix-turn-helix domain-containing protein n=1 Tax=Escherichia coli TaxID=562 RepID=UPI00207BE07F